MCDRSLHTLILLPDGVLQIIAAQEEMLRKERELIEARKKLAMIRQQQYKFLPSELMEDSQDQWRSSDPWMLRMSLLLHEEKGAFGFSRNVAWGWLTYTPQRQNKNFCVILKCLIMPMILTFYYSNVMTLFVIMSGLHMLSINPCRIFIYLAHFAFLNLDCCLSLVQNPVNKCAELHIYTFTVTLKPSALQKIMHSFGVCVRVCACACMCV